MIIPRAVAHEDLPTFSSDRDPVFLRILDAIKTGEERHCAVWPAWKCMLLTINQIISEANTTLRQFLSVLASKFPSRELLWARDDEYHRYLQLKLWEKPKGKNPPDALEVLHGCFSKHDRLLVISEGTFDAHSLFQRMRFAGQPVVYFSTSVPYARLQSPAALWGQAMLQLVSQTRSLFSHMQRCIDRLGNIAFWTEATASMMFQLLLEELSNQPSLYFPLEKQPSVYFLLENIPFDDPKWESTWQQLEAMMDATSASQERPDGAKPLVRPIFMYSRHNTALHTAKSLLNMEPLDLAATFDSQPPEEFATAIVNKLRSDSVASETQRVFYKSLLLQCGFDVQKVCNIRATFEPSLAGLNGVLEVDAYRGDQLHFLYERVHKVFWSLQEWAGFALGWLLYAQRPLTADELVDGIKRSASTRGMASKLVGNLDGASILQNLRDVFGHLLRIERWRICFASETVRARFADLAISDDHDTEHEDAYQAGHGKPDVPSELQVAETLLVCISELGNYREDLPSLGLYAHKFCFYHFQHLHHNRHQQLKLRGQQKHQGYGEPDWLDVIEVFNNKAYTLTWKAHDRKDFEKRVVDTGRLWTNGPLVMAAQLGLTEVVAHFLSGSSSDEKWDAVCTAIVNGHADVVYVITASKLHDNQSSLSFALLAASQRNYIPLIKHLLNDATEEARHQQLLRVICQAAELNYLDQLKVLVSYDKLSLITRPSLRDETPLRFAARGGHLAVVKYLVEECGVAVFHETTEIPSEASSDSSASEDSGIRDFVPISDNPILLAVAGRHAAVALYLLDQITIVTDDDSHEFVEEKRFLEKREMSVAVERRMAITGHMAKANRHSSKAKRRRKSRTGRKNVGTWGLIEAAIDTACTANDIETAKKIFYHKAVVAIPASERVLSIYNLIYVVRAEPGAEADSMAMLLLKSSMKPPQGTKRLRQLFREAAIYGQPELLQYCLDKYPPSEISRLLSHTFDLFAGGEDSTALHLAAKMGHVSIAKLLLERGANIDSLDLYECTPLMLAVRGGHTKVVTLLLKRGADPNASDGVHISVLAAAAASVHCERETDIVRALLRAGAVVDSVQSRRASPLLRAALSGHINILDMLLKHPKTDISATGSMGRNALHTAAESTSRTAVVAAQMLIQAGVNFHDSSTEGLLPVHSAAASDNVDVMELLLWQDAGMQHDIATDTGKPLLHMVHQRCACLLWLIDHGVDLDARDEDGDTLLAIAARKNWEQVIGLLLDAGADAGALNFRGESALKFAVEAKKHDAANMLLKANHAVLFQLDSNNASVLGLAITNNMIVLALDAISAMEKHATANLMQHDLLRILNAVSTTSYRTLLQSAVAKQQGQVVEKLLELGPDLEVRDNIGMTALDVAISLGNLELVQTLLAARARDRVKRLSPERDNNIASHDKSRQRTSMYSSSLYRAASAGDYGMVDLLLSNDFDVNEECGQFNTALVAATYSGSKGLVELLLARGADPMLPGGSFPTALATACMIGSTPILTLLIETDKRAALVRDTQGRNALHFAMQNGFWSAFAMLLDVAKDLHQEEGKEQKGGQREGEPKDDNEERLRGLFGTALDRDKQGRTLMHYAASWGDRRIVLNLLEQPDLNAKADITTADIDGWTPLHWACRIEEGTDTVELLLELGADPGAETKDGWTPLNISEYHGATQTGVVIKEALRSRAKDGIIDSREPLERGSTTYGLTCDGCMLRVCCPVVSLLFCLMETWAALTRLVSRMCGGYATSAATVRTMTIATNAIGRRQQLTLLAIHGPCVRARNPRTLAGHHMALGPQKATTRVATRTAMMTTRAATTRPAMRPTRAATSAERSSSGSCSRRKYQGHWDVEDGYIASQGVHSKLEEGVVLIR